jgi:hypothetical protein
MDAPSPTNPPPARRPFSGIRFRSSVPLVHDDGSQIPESWHLHCLTCEYDLTGLVARVCPECGKPFDPYKVWRANRDKANAMRLRTPAYIPYGVLVMVLLLTMPLILHQPRIVLPLLVLPIFEGLTFYYRKNAADARSLVMILCGIACVTWWSMT